MEETPWLSDEEQLAWRKLAAVVTRLPALLEGQLQREANLSHFEYWVLALLSEAPERSLRLSALAEQVNGSLSRLSHVVTRLERRAAVARRPCPDDARATMAVLTDAGYELVAQAAPGHVRAVRAAVFAELDGAGVRDLDRVCAALLTGIDRASAG